MSDEEVLLPAFFSWQLYSFSWPSWQWAPGFRSSGSWSLILISFLMSLQFLTSWVPYFESGVSPSCRLRNSTPAARSRVSDSSYTAIESFSRCSHEIFQNTVWLVSKSTPSWEAQLLPGPWCSCLVPWATSDGPSSGVQTFVGSFRGWHPG